MSDVSLIPDGLQSQPSGFAFANPKVSRTSRIVSPSVNISVALLSNGGLITQDVHRMIFEWAVSPISLQMAQQLPLPLDFLSFQNEFKTCTLIR